MASDVNARDYIINNKRTHSVYNRVQYGVYILPQ